jgi:hypothetical protein
MKFTFILFQLCLFICCNSTNDQSQDKNSCLYRFEDSASFLLPKSNLEAIVTSQGFVNCGSDTGQGTANITLCSTKDNNTCLKLLINESRIISFEMNNISTTVSKDKFLRTILFECGFNNLVEAEISEFETAIFGITMGHKVGFLPGQTHYIEMNEYRKKEFPCRDN